MILRRYDGEDKKQVLFYQEPSNIRGTAFLTYDYADASRDDTVMGMVGGHTSTQSSGARHAA